MLALLAALALGGAGGGLAVHRNADRFDHWQHRELFPTCTGCHAGAAEPSRAIWPSASDCATCHDGEIERKVDWNPPPPPHPSNLRFTHRSHAEAAAKRLPPDSVTCSSCHSPRGGPRMRVQRSVVRQCLDCHGIESAHLAAPDTACVTCHVPLVKAVALSTERIAHFPAPPSHREPGFAEHHEPAASCATCHARDFCTSCHVNAPEVPAIQALAPDRRSLAIATRLEEPASHKAPDFITHHGRDARRRPTSCATTAGSTTSPPAATRRTASPSSSRSETRSLSR
jgi:hypothetical protein